MVGRELLDKATAGGILFIEQLRRKREREEKRKEKGTLYICMIQNTR